MKNLSKLQSSLYKEIVKHTNVEIFNREYDKLKTEIPQNSLKYYPKYQVFVQGYINGTPTSLKFNSIKEILSNSGYKYPSSDRAWVSFYKVLSIVYSNLIER